VLAGYAVCVDKTVTGMVIIVDVFVCPYSFLEHLMMGFASVLSVQTSTGRESHVAKVCGPELEARERKVALASEP
jgi:hypothetical protein